MTMTEEISDCATVVKKVREYASASSQNLFWKDVVACRLEKEQNEWHVIYEASPSLTAPYYRYEAIVDAKTGNIKSVTRLDQK